MRPRISGRCACGVSCQIRCTAIAWTGGWQIPVVRAGGVGAPDAMAHSHRSGPGKYGSPGPARNTMCGTMPVSHCAANRCSSSFMARRTSRCAHPIALKALSQFHWCGYRCGDAFVQPPASLPCSTWVAPPRSAAAEPAVTLTASLLLTLGAGHHNVAAAVIHPVPGQAESDARRIPEQHRSVVQSLTECPEMSHRRWYKPERHSPCRSAVPNAGTEAFAAPSGGPLGPAGWPVGVGFGLAGRAYATAPAGWGSQQSAPGHPAIDRQAPGACHVKWRGFRSVPGRGQCAR